MSHEFHFLSFVFAGDGVSEERRRGEMLIKCNAKSKNHLLQLKRNKPQSQLLLAFREDSGVWNVFIVGS